LALTTDRERAEPLRRLSPHSLLLLPLLARGERLGVLTLLVTRSDRSLAADDLALAAASAHHAALSLDNARRHSAALAELELRKHASDETQRVLELHRLIARATNDPAWDWDIPHKQVVWNDDAVRLYGTDDDSVP